MEKEIYVFDLDGTIVFNGREISKEILPLLKKLDRKATLIFASARPIRDMLPVLKDFPDNDLIGANGAMIRSKGKIHLSRRISPSSCQTIFSVIKRYQLDYIVDYDWDYSAAISDPDNHILEKLDAGKSAQALPLTDQNVSKIILFGIEETLAADLAQLKGIQPLYHEGVHELNITAQGIDKAQALSDLIARQDYTAFGNDKNDFLMLEQAAKGYYLGKDGFSLPHIQTIDEQDLISILEDKIRE